MSRLLIPHYTDAVLAFDMADGDKPAPPAAPTAEEVRAFTERTLSLRNNFV